MFKSEVEKRQEDLLGYKFGLPEFFKTFSSKYDLSWFLNNGIRTVMICNMINRGLSDEQIQKRLKGGG